MPTDISQTRLSQSRARAFPEDELRAPPREGKRRRSGPSGAKGSAMARLAAAVPLPRLSTGAVVACAAFCALMTGVVVNALYLQTDKHSAPMFPPEAAASAAPGQRVNMRAAEARAPAATPAPRVAATPETAAPLPAPRPPQREITGSLGRQPDGLEALLAGAAAPTRTAQATAPKPKPALNPAFNPAPKPAPKPKPAAAPAPKQPRQAVAEHRRAAAPKPRPVAAKVAAKPAADPSLAARKPAVATAKDKSNSVAVTGAISDEMRRKLAAISGAPPKAKPAKTAADDEE